MWFLAFTALCFWILCGVGAFSLVRRLKRPTIYDSILIIVLGPITLLGLLVIANHDKDS